MPQEEKRQRMNFETKHDGPLPPGEDVPVPVEDPPETPHTEPGAPVREPEPTPPVQR